MDTRFPAVAVPNNASKANSSPAGNIVESYKMIAEQVLEFGTQQISDTAHLCIAAARLHLESQCSSDSQPLEDHTPSTYGSTVAMGTVVARCGCIA